MKTLEAFIVTLEPELKEMMGDGWLENGTSHLMIKRFIRLACEAMAKEIVPNEKLMDRILHNYTKPELDKTDAWNDCHDIILKNIERFMGGGEMMPLIQFLKDELEGNVDILESGAISIQSLFLKKFLELGGDERYLYSLIEDYIFTDGDGETFDAVKLIEEYERKILKGASK